MSPCNVEVPYSGRLCQPGQRLMLSYRRKANRCHHRGKIYKSEVITVTNSDTKMGHGWSKANQRQLLSGLTIIYASFSTSTRQVRLLQTGLIISAQTASALVKKMQHKQCWQCFAICISKFLRKLKSFLMRGVLYYGYLLQVCHRSLTCEKMK